MIDFEERDLTAVNRKSFFDQQDTFDDTPPLFPEEDAPQKNYGKDNGGSTPVVHGYGVVAVSAEIFSISDTTPVSVGDFLGRIEEMPLVPSPYEPATDAEAENAVSDRITLLARQYVRREVSAEDEARLTIATEKVRQLIPRVTAEDVEALNEMLEEAKELEQQDNEQRKRLGIDTE
jgi:hypothetical protein